MSTRSVNPVSQKLAARVADPPSRRDMQAPEGLLRNLISLYGLYGSNYLLALVTVPYLGRVLGPSGWGLVAFIQAFGGYLLLIVEFGFTLSATREVARNREMGEKLGEILGGVLGAKGILALLCVLIALPVQATVPGFREHPLLFWSGVIWALAQGSSLMWYYQGLERMRLAAGVDVAIKSLGVLGIFLFVRTAADAWKVLALQGLASVLSLLICMVLAYREVPIRFPTATLVRQTLRKSLHTFMPRNAMILYTVGNAFILGLFAPPHVVGYYAAADRISRAVLGLLEPVSQAFFPRISQLVKGSQAEVRRLARFAVVVLTAIGLLMGLATYFLAPRLVALAVGPGFEPATCVLRIFAILPPLIGLRNVLGLHWMLPLNLDWPFNVIILSAGVVNLALALLVAPVHAHVGMAWAAVASHAFATAGTYVLLRWMDLDPLSRKSPGDQPQLKYLVNRVAD